jgi:hypothetical protein
MCYAFHCFVLPNKDAVSFKSNADFPLLSFIPLLKNQLEGVIECIFTDRLQLDQKSRRPQRKTISEKMGKKMKFPQICETRKLSFLDFFGIFFLFLKTTWLNWLGLIGLA